MIPFIYSYLFSIYIYALKKASDFNEGVQDILDWVKEMKTALEMMAPPIFSMAKSQEQNTEQEACFIFIMIFEHVKKL